jgi:hypothetical protein
VALSNIDRFKEVNVAATRPEDVLNPNWIPSYQFLRQCIEALPKLEFADQDSAKIYGRIEKAGWVYKNAAAKPNSANADECLATIGWDAPPAPNPLPIEVIDSDLVKMVTLGAWGASQRVESGK